MPEEKEFPYKDVWAVTEPCHFTFTEVEGMESFRKAMPDGCVGFFALFEEFDDAARYAKDIRNIVSLRVRK